jgi:hypothetical protein
MILPHRVAMDSQVAVILLVAARLRGVDTVNPLRDIRKVRLPVAVGTALLPVAVTALLPVAAVPSAAHPW